LIVLKPLSSSNLLPSRWKGKSDEMVDDLPTQPKLIFKVFLIYGEGVITKTNLKNKEDNPVSSDKSHSLQFVSALGRPRLNLAATLIHVDTNAEELPTRRN
jgi:hypothetical protein